MLFSEPSFLFFFLPVLFWLYWLSPHRLRNALLAAASLLFYTLGEKQYAVIMMASIGLNYAIGRGLTPERPERTRRALVVAGVVVNLSILGWFKYAGFFVGNLNVLLDGMGVGPIAIGEVHLPIGISFFTFQAMSYVIDVYRHRVPVQRNVLDLALYIALFPQLIAGPIVRYQHVARQIVSRVVTAPMFESGVRRFVLGFGKKMIIANAVAFPCDQIFALPAHELTVALSWLGVVCYTLQIYFDFSGYSDMAIGLGRMFGFTFQENFNYPYISRCATDFWRRWHISLSSWFRDYLYITLGGNRVSPLRTYFNLVTVFFLCGLWHGANWMFVVWGLYHGFFLVVERVGLQRQLERLPVPAQHLYSIVVFMFGWLCFRVATGPVPDDDLVRYTLHYVAAMVGASGADSVRSVAEFITAYEWTILLVGVVASTPALKVARGAFAMQLRSTPWRERGGLRRGAYAMSTVALLGVFFVGVLKLAADTYNPFIYFQF